MAIFNAKVAPLKDGHVVISPTGDLPASAQYSPFYQEFPTKALQTQFHQVTLDQLRQRGFGPLVSFQSAPYQIGGYCRSNQQNVKRRFYVHLPAAIRPRMQWPFVKRNARRLTISHHISLGEKKYVRIHLSQGGGKEEMVLVVLDQAGHIVEHCALSYNYLSSQFYQ